MPIFIFFVIFALWSMYEIRKSSATHQARRDAFWDNERAANDVRRQDISQLNYITIPFDLLPFNESATPPVLTYQNNIKELKDRRILNLTGYTNTELKFQYGAANLQDLTEYDENFTKLASNLARWGQALYDSGNLADAKTIFEYGISIHTDVSNNYLTLGRIYLSEDRIDAIYELMEQASDLKTLMKDSIIQHLRELLEQDSQSTR